jgi:lipopolysaccharide/colanic/teichoic acid biosynthesis glycosyltransferase
MDSMNPYRGKRALDLLVAGTACMLFAPVVAGVTIAVWLEDGGPPLFWQLTSAVDASRSRS